MFSFISRGTFTFTVHTHTAIFTSNILAKICFAISSFKARIAGADAIKAVTVGAGGIIAFIAIAGTIRCRCEDAKCEQTADKEIAKRSHM
jgi:hypothetical protein